MPLADEWKDEWHARTESRFPAEGDAKGSEGRILPV